MQFCPIPPVGLLSKYLSERKTWFALAHEQDHDYQVFYRDRPKGTTLILDNGSYEGMMDTETYADAIKFYKPEVAVLPDLYLGNWSRSLNLSLNFLDNHSRPTYTNAWMFVPQATPGDVDGFLESVTKALKD